MDEMLSGMSSRALTEWMAYFNAEPFGDELIDIHMAQIASILINANLKKGAPQMTPEKMRLWKVVRKPFDPQEYFNQLKTSLTFKKWEE